MTNFPVFLSLVLNEMFLKTIFLIFLCLVLTLNVFYSFFFLNGMTIVILFLTEKIALLLTRH